MRSLLTRPSRLRVAAMRLLSVSALTVGASLALAPSALANCCIPKSGGSPNANAIASLYTIILVMAIIVFVAVIGTLLYAVFKFRADKHPVAAQIHGNTRLEIGWTAAAAGILVILTIVTFIKLPSIINAPNSSAASDRVLSASLTQPNPPNGKKLTICVTARQFIWRYTYGAGCNKNYYFTRLPYTYQEMFVPAGETINLLIQSSDVIHAWWVPQLGGKVDAEPGYTTYTWFKADKVGALYKGQCAQLCGRQHAFMTAFVRVLSPTQWLQWRQRQVALIAAQNNQVSQLRQELIQTGNLTSNGQF